MRSLRAVCVARFAPTVTRRTTDRRLKWLGSGSQSLSGRLRRRLRVEKECMTVSSKVRIYDLAKELKLDTKRLIEEVRREGVDVSVPSNSVSKELAEKIRNKYFPKKETAVKRSVKVVKRATAPLPELAALDDEPEVHEQEPAVAAPPSPPPASSTPVEPVEAPPVASTPAAQQPLPARLVKKLTPAVRAEAPAPEVVETPAVAAEPMPAAPPVVQEPVPVAPIEARAPPANGVGVEVRTPAPAPAPAPPP